MSLLFLVAFLLFKMIRVGFKSQMFLLFQRFPFLFYPIMQLLHFKLGFGRRGVFDLLD